jgi:ribose 5-phosphate isomerase B
MSESPSAVILGSDHAAFALKERIRAALRESGVTVEDVGTFSEASVDYPDIAARLVAGIRCGRFQRGILLCGTGIGMSMAANRHPGIRAALCHDLFTAILSRQHNDANVLVLGGRILGDALALAMVKAWLETPFDGGRHAARLQKLETCQDLSIPDGTKGT